MKRKILVFAPVLALMLSGCFARTPLDPSGTSGTSGKTSGSTSTSSVTPAGDTYGTLDNPITVAKALEIGKAIPGATSDNTVFETKDAYVKGIVKSKPTPGDDNTLSFNFADTYGSSTYIQYWKGAFNSMVKEGDEVVAFGRLAIYKNKSVELTGDSEKSIEPPSVKVVNHIDCTMTLQKTGEGSVEGIPATAKTGDVITFTVTPAEGYSVEYVKANGTNLVESSGKYSFVVATNTTIVVSLVEGPIVVSDLQKAYEGAIAGKTDEFTYSGTVVGTVGNSFYIQEGKYGMYVYSKTAISDVALGKVVEITSTVKTYNDLVETDVIKSAKVTGEGTMPTAATVSSLSDLQLLNQNVLMNIGEAEFVTRDQPWASKTPSIVDFKVGNDTIKVKFDGYGYDEDKAKLINEAEDGDKFTLTNALSSMYKGTQQVAFAGSSEIAKAGPVVPVTGVTLNETKLSLEVGEDSLLVATVEPSTATNKKVSWSSNKEAVASVDSTGKVHAESEGEAVITVTTEDGGKTASCTVTVKPVSVKSVELNKHELSGVKGGSEKLIATVSPSTAKNKDVTWTVENANPAGCVSVDNEGNVSFVEVGTATVKVTTVDGGKTDTCAVTVTSSKVDVTGIKLDKESITATAGDAAQTITATVEPNDATVNTVTWTVEDANPTGCVTIVADGLKATVTFVAAGSAKVVATSDDSDVTVSKACTVTVEAAPEPETHGTLENPITVAEARAIAVDLNNTTANTTVYDTVDAYVQGVVKGNPEESTKTPGTYKFYFADTIDDSSDISFYWGTLDTGVDLPIKGESVVIFGRLADFFNKDGTKHTYEMAGNGSDIAVPKIMKVIPVTPSSVDISSTASKVVVGNSIELKGVIGPTGARGTISWEITAGSSYATLSDSTLTGVAAGTVTVKATVVGTEVTATKDIVVSSEAPTEAYKLVTDVSTLADGDKIVISNKAMDYGMKIYASGNNCRGTSITADNQTISELGEAGEFVLEAATDGCFYIKSGTQYLYAASSSGNQLKAKDSKDSVNGVWEFTYNSTDGEMSIVAKGSSNRNVMRYNYNNGSPLFACYASATQTGLQVFRYC